MAKVQKRGRPAYQYVPTAKGKALVTLAKQWQ